MIGRLTPTNVAAAARARMHTQAATPRRRRVRAPTSRTYRGAVSERKANHRNDTPERRPFTRVEPCRSHVNTMDMDHLDGHRVPSAPQSVLMDGRWDASKLWALTL